MADYKSKFTGEEIDEILSSFQQYWADDFNKDFNNDFAI